MDLIKQEIMRKRQALAEDTGGTGKRFFKRSELEQKRVQKVKEEEKRELEEKANRHPQESSSSSTASLLDLIYSVKSNTDSTAKAVTLTAEEQSIDELDLPRQEVIRRLRLLKQPITLFGEDDPARLDRLKYVLKTGTFEVDSDLTEGQTNDFLRDIVELKKRQKTGIMNDRKRKSEDLEDDEGDKGDEDLSGEGASSGVDADKDLKLMKAKLEDLCEEDKILVFFKRLLNEWNQELNEMQNLSRRTAKGKQMVATFKQCARYLTPLFKFCRKRALPDDIKKALMVVVNCCMERDYRTAVDCYIKMAIGNAPWPIGVTMVGIHERSAREKIYTNSVAHIMNDETTRKYLQSVKRLVTFCQRKYPTVPSRSIEFNSLANGSDLQALLMDEHCGGGGNQASEERHQSSEERLKLMPAPSDE